MTEKNHSNDDAEMSMDEILASIKRYVADETPEANLSGVEHHSGHTADVIKLTDAIDNARPMDKTQFTPFTKVSDETYTKPSPRYEDNVYRGSFEQHGPPAAVYQQSYEHKPVEPVIQNYGHSKQFQDTAAPVFQDERKYAPIERPASILSEHTTQATTNAFSKLTEAFQAVKTEKDTAQKTVNNASAIESFVIEMARPMIRHWIDENLPDLVNKLVTEEIQKLTDDLRKKIF
jgi:cell pole-organizing protein PopZ